MFILKKTEQNNVDGDFGPHNLVLPKASSLSEDLVDEEVFEPVDHVVLPDNLSPIKRGRKKKEYNNSMVRRSVRIRRKPKKY